MPMPSQQEHVAAPAIEALSQAALTDYIEVHYHAMHRRELAQLTALAEQVELDHARHPAVPKGLAALLDATAVELENHMRKEEWVLFPALRRGARGDMIDGPVGVMRHEHDDHTWRLAQIRERAGNFELPPDASDTWAALYRGLRKLEHDLLEHIHIENELLFARAVS